MPLANGVFEDVHESYINAMVKGRRAITAATDLHLCRFFGLSGGFWLRMQSSHDLRGAYGHWANPAPDGPEWEICAERIAVAP